jgi:hypothetical protein
MVLAVVFLFNLFASMPQIIDDDPEPITAVVIMVSD